MASTMVYKALTGDPDFTKAITAASIHHAVRSSAAAQVNAATPSFDLVSPLSLSILANTGNAVMLIAMPMNKENDKKEMPAGA